MLPSFYVTLIVFCAFHRLAHAGPVVFEEEDEDIFVDYESKHENCWRSGTVYWNETDQCYRPATRGPCDEGEWIVLTGDPSQSSSVQCRRRPCTANQALVNGTCHAMDRRSSKICSSQEILLNSPFGLGQCVCRQGFLQFNDGKCYRPYTRGPCPDGEFLLYNSSSGDESSFECAENPCKQDGSVPYAGSCFKLGDGAACKAAPESLEIDFDTLQPKCLDAMVQLRQIAIVRYHCGAGSPLLRTRYCRTPFEFGKPSSRS